MSRKVSIIINTYNRAESLEKTLESFKWLDYPHFEVVVVNGPSTDNTQEVISKWSGKIKSASCSELNLSVSRNIGIKNSSGDILAFIDDDGIPEPEWLSRIVSGYDKEDIAAIGGFVFNHTGFEYQAKYIFNDRFGYHVQKDSDSGLDSLCFPYSHLYPSMVGVNSTFRRDHLIAVGGFDEFYAYFLDETDVVVRLVDKGYRIKIVPEAYVHHKGAPSSQRRYYLYCRSQAYFIIVNASELFSRERVELELKRLRDEKVQELKTLKERLSLTDEQINAGIAEIEQGIKDGIERANSQNSRTLLKAFDPPSEFVQFETIKPDKKRLIIGFVSQEYSASSNGGIGKWTKAMAEGLAEKGHYVHVISHSQKGNTVDWENGVWVHRITSKENLDSLPVDLPPWPKARSASVLAEVKRINSHHPLDVITAPIYDLEGIRCVMDPSLKVITTLQTTYGLSLDSHPEWKTNSEFWEKIVLKMLEGEKWILSNSRVIHSISNAMVKLVLDVYDVHLPEDRTHIFPIGIPDLSAKRSRTDSNINILFVGRFEARKGIDVLLDVIPKICELNPSVNFTLAGDYNLPGADGRPYVEAFIEKYKGEPFLERIMCPGKVDDSTLYSLYANSDIFVAPSRFESFGIIFLEAMMHGKPVIGCKAGGMPEVIDDGITGLLSLPGDSDSLFNCLQSLISDKTMREKMGEASREKYMREFTIDKMIHNLENLYLNLISVNSDQENVCLM